MQNPNEDTEWNDILRSKGILPPKEEATVDEDTIVQMMEQAVQEKVSGRSKALEDMTLDEIDEMEDEEDERVLLQYRKQRMSEILALQQKAKFGSMKEITAVDYVDEVNKAGDEVWVVLHLYTTGFIFQPESSTQFDDPLIWGEHYIIPLCALLNQHLSQLAVRFPATKFLKSIASTCIPNYPDRNLPTIFVYCEGDLKGQMVGPISFGGMNLTIEDLEWMLSEQGALRSSLKEDPRKKREVRDVMSAAVKSCYRDAEDSDDDSD